MALEAALSTVVRAERPRFAGVQRAINADLERLRAVPIVDVQGVSARLDVLVSLVSRAPLLVPDAAAPTDGDGRAAWCPVVAAAGEIGSLLKKD